MKYSERVILVDVDGVLLMWLEMFIEYMNSHGHILHDENTYNLHDGFKMTSDQITDFVDLFHESAILQSLPPYLDAVKYVKKLHDEFGYVLHCITAIPGNPYTKMARTKNLETVFGADVIERLECVGHSRNKYPVLTEYKNSGKLWVEDHFANALMGAELGLKSVIMDARHNRQYSDERIKRVKNWEDIYHMVSETHK